MALAVLRTSSPSSMPVMRVAPTVSAPKISARIDIDLSPGTRTRPVSRSVRRAVSGTALACIAVLPRRARHGAPFKRPLSRPAASRHPACFYKPKPGGGLFTAAPRLAKWSTRIRLKDRTVAKPELGTKRLCASCAAKFYDLNKDPIHCPKCGAVYEVAVATRPVRPEPAPAPVARAPVPEEAPAVAEPQEVETVSLEEADAEARGATAKKPAGTEPEAEEEEVEMDETLDDNDTFIEEQEEEDADVTDIIGGDRENEEEG